MEFIKRYGIWCPIVLSALAFAAAGTFKLMGTPELHQSFALLGLPSWFGYFIGTAEVAGAIGLLFARTRLLAAIGLAIIMVGAVYFHVAFTPLGQTVPALVLLGFMLLIVHYQRGRNIA
ncbi:MAG: DoxX family protein [Pseudomonadota bacterium]